MTSKFHPLSNKRSSLQRLLHYGQKYQGQIYQASTYSVINTILDLAPPWLIGVAVDILVQKQDSFIGKLGIQEVVWQFALLSLITVIVWIFESLSEYAYNRLWRNLAQNIQHNLRLDAYNHLQELESAYFEDSSTGGLMSILGDDINQLEDFLNGGANEIIQVTTSFIILIGGAFLILPLNITLAAMLPMPFILWGSLVYQKQLEPRYAEVREKVSFLNSRLANNISGITTIKSFTAEKYESARLAAESEAYKKSNAKAIKLSAAFIPVIRMLVLVGFTALLFLGGMAAYSGKISVGNYSILLVLVQRLLWPLVFLGETFDRYQRAMASTKRVMDLLDTSIEITTGDVPLVVEQVRGEVNFKNVTFAYQNNTAIIKELSLHIPDGNTIAVVGSTGSGKSTLVKLLLRFYDVSHGSITVDGIDIQKLNLSDLRRSIGLVSQDVFLFHGTVAENIAYGTFDATDEAIINAAKVAEAHDFIMQLSQGYETIVGERGQKLSGGQRQRIAIARAVLKNPPILILDEATSAVDNETEAAIQRSLDKITVNRTTIAIAHRLSTIRHSHCIYVMDHGQIVEQGKHEDLLALDGIYALLWRVQSGIY
ncbi:ABC transporter ATP-binding protein [Anabaena cylindrica FACHB-243]|uniref:Xenobiotic-transporting ATPase n=1 Tax=Anabaena cylindrica (strain ATCC 27899 / PCC 7122) TaxID=272123 RepID=K9ZK52_ANACC|nr:MULTISPECIES: ABC transporter ATP-binding protein [Anabaena]AFZ59623.1 Xenobiotic-transporting ATPase [Anabaena cylindrica PCC 7122]MBD2418714.1 ABC transporter ATP-binding protein [Anabaena cylindrica FACHB-243]MBY5281659.1 ABC transporter ATP-binding protein [Anabaena sp. CCAP 1446/1C]MBY5309185.1 ABC transporter ATP-binding protein [Anabaena sp. CCAP 1446/1C]MCM2406277.1 ABC transporter ATP-binding protein/permease [Anabaena sp. CCAP 1446/1C]